MAKNKSMAQDYMEANNGDGLRLRFPFFKPRAPRKPMSTEPEVGVGMTQEDVERHEEHKQYKVLKRDYQESLKDIKAIANGARNSTVRVWMAAKPNTDGTRTVQAFINIEGHENQIAITASGLPAMDAKDRTPFPERVLLEEIIETYRVSNPNDEDHRGSSVPAFIEDVGEKYIWLTLRPSINRKNEFKKRLEDQQLAEAKNKELAGMPSTDEVIA